MVILGETVLEIYDKTASLCMNDENDAGHHIRIISFRDGGGGIDDGVKRKRIRVSRKKNKVIAAMVSRPLYDPHAVLNLCPRIYDPSMFGVRGDRD